MFSIFYAHDDKVIPLLRPFQRLPSQPERKAIKALVTHSSHPPLFLLTWIQPHWPPAMILPQDLCTCCSFCLGLSPSDIFMTLSAYHLQIFTSNVCLVVTSLAYSPHSTHTDSFSLPVDTYYNLINNIPCLVWQCIIYCLTSLCKCHNYQRGFRPTPHQG